MDSTTQQAQIEVPAAPPTLEVEARIARLGGLGGGIDAARMESLTIAHGLGVDDVLFARLGSALRLSRAATIVLPSHRFERLSRGKGWARKGTGPQAEWGERVKGGYLVGPGKWTVGGSDGFTRKGSDSWTVAHVSVAGQTWTVAS